MRFRWQVLASTSAALALFAVNGCVGRGALEENVAADIDAVTEAEVIRFGLDPKRGPGGSELEFELAPGQVTLSTEDLVAAVKVIDEYRPDHRVMYSQLGVGIKAGEINTGVGWSERSADAQFVEIWSAYGPYNDSYCELADLRILHSAGRGSDFSQIGSCNPKLERLWINSWPDSTGRQGLAELVNLKELAIMGPVDDVMEIPALPSLERLTIHLADDTPENRQQLAERLPNCKIIYDDIEAKLAFDPTADPS